MPWKITLSPMILAGIGLFLLTVFAVIFLLRRRKRNKTIVQGLGMSLFLIKMPRHEGTQEKEKNQDIKSLIGKMEQIYSNFLYLKKGKLFSAPSRVALEVASETGGEDISFYAAVPDYLKNDLGKHIQGVYPGATVEEVPQDYTVFEPGGTVSGASLKLKNPSYFPIRTYKELDSDPLNSLTNALSKITAQEGAAVQIILRPTSFKLKERGSKILSSLREGKSIKAALAEVNKSFLEKFFEFFSNLNPPNKEKELKDKKTEQKPVGDESVIQSIQAKIQKTALEANIRIVGVGQNKERADNILNQLKSAFSQFSSALNSFEPKEMKRKNLQRFIYNFSFRNFNKKEKLILNLEELTSIYHLPLPYVESPNIKWVKTKESAPPTELPSSGLILIGRSVFRGEEKPVYFASREDRRRHFYIIGQTGVGKTALLREMIRQDIEKGEGVGVIDPHGDLIEDTLANIPKERADDVVLFEPFDMDRPCGLNMLEWETPEQKDFAVSEMITIFSKLFPPEIIGPMFEHYMRNAMLSLMADKENPGTLVEIPRIFTDKDFMEKRLRAVQDPLVRNFWTKEWAQTTGSTRSDMLGYVVSKVGRFVENEMMRNIIGQSHSGFNLDKIMDEKKIFLANLSKGLTGEMNSSLLGLILVSKIQIAALRRGWLPLEERKDFYLYLDEFQNFTTDSIATILAEARKYRLNLILAHQFIPQLKEEIKNAVIGNAGSIAAFRVGAEDAEFLEKQFEPDFSRFDLINLDNFNLILKMIINNKTCSSFRVKTIPPKEGDRKLVESIKKLSKLKYGRVKQEVEREIAERSNIENL